MVKITFTAPVSSGRFSVWWAPGVVSAADLARVGASGHFLAQEAHLGTSIYDIMALPIPQHLGRTVTIGVLRLGDGGRQTFSVTLYLDASMEPPMIIGGNVHLVTAHGAFNLLQWSRR